MSAKSGRWTSERDIGAVIALHNQSFSLREIAEATGVKRSTAGDIIAREGEGNKKADGKRGRPPIADERFKRRIVKEQRTHPKASVESVLDVVCPVVSGVPRPARRTANHWINESGIYLGDIGGKSALTEAQKDARLHWAEQNVATQWFTAVEFWTDGAQFKKPVDPVRALEAYSFGPNLAKYAAGEANADHILAVKGGHRSQKCIYKQFFWCGFGGVEGTLRATLCVDYQAPMTAERFRDSATCTKPLVTFFCNLQKKSF